MKKLLFFILILFGILSVQSLANGCSAQICTCPGGGYVTTGQYCPVYNNNTPSQSVLTKWYAFSYDKNKNIYGVGTGYDKKTAQNEALKNCGTSECKIEKSQKIPGGISLAAVSSNGVMVTYSSFGSSTWEQYEKRIDNLIKKCKAKGGSNCKLVFDSAYLYRKDNNLGY